MNTEEPVDNMIHVYIPLMWEITVSNGKCVSRNSPYLPGRQQCQEHRDQQNTQTESHSDHWMDGGRRGRGEGGGRVKREQEKNMTFFSVSKISIFCS